MLYQMNESGRRSIIIQMGETAFIKTALMGH